MSDEITPDRLDALLDGAVPENDTERDMLHLAGALRAATPDPSAELRARVRALGEPRDAVRTPRTRRRRSWQVAAPALGAVIAAVVAVAVITSGGDSGGSTAGAPHDSVTPAASKSLQEGGADEGTSAARDQSTGPFATTSPDAAATLRAGTLDATVAALREVATSAGGTVATTTDGSITRVRLTAPAERMTELVQRALDVVAPNTSAVADAPAPPAAGATEYTLELTEGP